MRGVVHDRRAVDGSVVVVDDPHLAAALERQWKARLENELQLDQMMAAADLDRINHLCLSIGFPLLTLGVLAGSFWARIVWGSPMWLLRLPVDLNTRRVSPRNAAAISFVVVFPLLPATAITGIGNRDR